MKPESYVNSVHLSEKGNENTAQLLIVLNVCAEFVRTVPMAINSTLLRMSIEGGYNKTPGRIQIESREGSETYPAVKWGMVPFIHNTANNKCIVPGWFANNAEDLNSSVERLTIGAILNGEIVTHCYEPGQRDGMLENDLYMLAAGYQKNFEQDLSSRLYDAIDEEERIRLLNDCADHFYLLMSSRERSSLTEYKTKEDFREGFRSNAIKEMMKAPSSNRPGIRGILFIAWFNTIYWDYSVNRILALCNMIMENSNKEGVEPVISDMALNVLYSLMKEDSKG